MPSRKALTIGSLAVALTLGAANGAVFLWIEFQNNNQGEYYDTVTGQVDLVYCVEVFAVAAIPTALIALAILLPLTYFAGLLLKRRE